MLDNPLYWDQLNATNGNGLPDVPPIEVNGRELSEKRGLTDRALRNHLKQLMEVGAIVKKKFRGTRASFHVYMNAELVWEVPVVAAVSPGEPVAYRSNTGLISFTNGKKVPDNELLETLETSEKEITNGDKLLAESTAKVGTGNPLLETEARNCRVVKRKENGAGGGAITESIKDEPAGDVVQDPVRIKRIGYVIAFWMTAKKLIYPGRKWTSEQERQAKNAIWTGVYNGFYSHEDFDWESFQVSLLHRLQLVRNHLERHPERYAPLPYSEHKPGEGYFDEKNVRGFRGTAEWLKKANRHKQTLRVERALRVAIKELDQRKALERTPNLKLVASQRVGTLSLLQLVTYHIGELKRLGNAKAVDRFCKKVQNKVSKAEFKTISK